MDHLPNSLPATTTTQPATPALTSQLTSWLLAEPSDHKAIEVISKSEILKDEARAAVPALRAAAMAPATSEQIKATISQRFALFPQPQRNDLEWAAWWADYIDALSGLSAPAVEAGMAAWVKSPDAEWMAYYLSDTPGGICPFADVGTGEYVVQLGLAKSATVLGLSIQSSGTAN